jgi:hypothetical protein
MEIKTRFDLLGAFTAKLPPGEIEGMLKALTAAEKNVIYILYESPSTLTVKQIRSDYIWRIHNRLGAGAGLFESKEKIIINKDRLPPEAFIKEAYEYIADIREDLPNSQAVEKIAKVLTKCGVKPPSFGKIKSILDELQANKIIIMTKSDQKKALGYYLLESKFHAFIRDNKIKLV